MFCGRPNATGLQLLRDADQGANSPARLYVADHGAGGFARLAGL